MSENLQKYRVLGAFLPSSGKRRLVLLIGARSGLELDILLQTEKGMIGMEIKARTSMAPADLRPMREVAKGLGKEWRGGFVVYLGNSIRKVGEPNLWAVPSRRLFT